MIGGEIAKEGLVTATVKSTAEWIEHKLGINVEKFSEHVAVEVVAKLIVVTVLGLAFFFASRGIWRTIYRKFRAATIRKTASTSFVIVRCPIANDIDNAIGNEIGIRLETAFRAFAGKANTRPFHVMTFPLALSGDDGTKAYDTAVETAKRSLERTNGNVLIWGKRVKGDSVGMIRLIGKDRQTGTIEVRRVNFDKRAADFDQALANAIAYEAAQLTQVTLSEPDQVHLDVLREVSDKLKRLAASDAPALSNEWRERMAEEHWRLTDEIVRRTPSLEERKDFETAARIEIASLDPKKQPRRFAVTALRIVVLIRRKNWVDPNPDELNEARTLVDRAIPILESLGAHRECAEAALERTGIRRQQLRFKKTTEIENDAIYRADFQEAKRLVDLAKDESLDARLMAAGCSYPNIHLRIDALGSDDDGPAAVFSFVDRLSPHLDNEELLDLVDALRVYIINRGDRTLATEFWCAGPQILEAVLNSRSSWTKDERLLLFSMISYAAVAAGLRIEDRDGSDAATPYLSSANRFVSKVLDSFDWRLFAPHRYIELRACRHLGIHVSTLSEELLDRGLQALRASAGPSAVRFPRLQSMATATLVTTLNNFAKAFDSVKTAREAFQIATARNRELELDDRIKASDQYIAAYSAGQVARLTPRDDAAGRVEWSRKAHDMAEQALRRALDEENQLFASDANRVMHEMEAEFPELASDLEAAVIAADEESKKIEALSPKSSSGNQTD